MDPKKHWETIYQTKAPDTVSWYRPHLEKSLDLILKAVNHDSKAAIIDVGAGEATLVDDLLDRGFQNITVLDISKKAIKDTKQRLGSKASAVTWMIEDITRVELAAQYFDVWHDRAVFHFLTDPADREAYVKRVAQSVKTGGHVIVATFGPEGPEKCSGLNVVRYDAESLHDQFGARFKLVEHTSEEHETPFGTTQQFLYCYCKVEAI
ncbi:MAG: SAM-dependent methyltransferase [Nitrososphaera sp.]|nr:SAM-dependent methyltransferase [Nitrososphaera sp.]